MAVRGDRLRIIVTGLVGLNPVGGVAWDYLQYLIGLSRLGHDVYYHEDTWSWPYHPLEKTFTDDPSYSTTYLRDFFARYAPELGEHWHYRHLHQTSYGMRHERFAEIARSCELFINISGANMIPEELSPSCVKVFLDTDPGYNQIVMSERFAWSENADRWCEGIAAHDRYFTYAENIHGEDCQVPKLDMEWRTTRMPIVTGLWQRLSRTPTAADRAWTTVMTWSAFKGPLIYKGREYTSKGGEFERFIELPKRVDEPLEVAIGGRDAPIPWLREHGWSVVDGPAATLRAEDYVNFINRSRGEFSTAKNVYVALRTGWFSCRSACYLAAGRPVVVQNTGFSKLIPSGDGLISFNTLEDAAEGLERMRSDYPRHCRAATELAEEYFSSDRVLSQMLEDAFVHQSADSRVAIS